MKMTQETDVLKGKEADLFVAECDMRLACQRAALRQGSEFPVWTNLSERENTRTRADRPESGSAETRPVPAEGRWKAGHGRGL